MQEPERSTADEKSLYHNQIFVILRTLVRLKGFKEDPKWIREHLLIKNISEELIASSFRDLERLGFIQREKDGSLKVAPESLWRPDPLDPSGQQVFSSAANFSARLMETPEIFKPSVYMGLTLALNEEQLKNAEKFMIDVHHRLSVFAAESQNPTAVVNVGNFFLTIFRLKQ